VVRGLPVRLERVRAAVDQGTCLKGESGVCFIWWGAGVNEQGSSLWSDCTIVTGPGQWLWYKKTLKIRALAMRRQVPVDTLYGCVGGARGSRCG